MSLTTNGEPTTGWGGGGHTGLTGLAEQLHAFGTVYFGTNLPLATVLAAIG